MKSKDQIKLELQNKIEGELHLSGIMSDEKREIISPIIDAIAEELANLYQIIDNIKKELKQEAFGLDHKTNYFPQS